jgi:ribA/ribD-fused uncharacterized protein
MPSITRFSGEHAFLSNFFPCSIPVGSAVAPTAEHAFQALKTSSEEAAHWVLRAGTPGGAKQRGRQVPLRPRWGDVRVRVMEQVLRRKFAPGSELAGRLLATGDAELVEGNDWNDRFWGVCRGKGENHLGRLLMKIREELQRGADWDEASRSPIPLEVTPTGFVPPRRAPRRTKVAPGTPAE